MVVDGRLLVVGLEFLFMISPLGFFFYSSYGPLLNSLHVSPVTAWLTGFFLPHVSFTDSELVNSIKPWGFRVAGFGLLVFLVGAIQIYGAKLLRRREVTGDLYRISRHPQYAALAVLAFGVLLVWPQGFQARKRGTVDPPPGQTSLSGRP